MDYINDIWAIYNNILILNDKYAHPYTPLIESLDEALNDVDLEKIHTTLTIFSFNLSNLAYDLTVKSKLKVNELLILANIKLNSLINLPYKRPLAKIMTLEDIKNKKFTKKEVPKPVVEQPILEQPNQTTLPISNL